MCYNCGCGRPKDDMGNGKINKGGGSLTEDDFNHMAKIWGQPSLTMKKNTLKLLQKELLKKS